MSWAVGETPSGKVHATPIDDLREHRISVNCWCSPRLEEDGNVVIHNSLDGREAFERGERKPS